MTSTLLNGCEKEYRAGKTLFAICGKNNFYCPICLARISQRIEDLQEVIKGLRDSSKKDYCGATDCTVCNLKKKYNSELEALQQAIGETK